jgi:putative radical SAM enzyme (TIGR03279 family)
MCKNNCVFCFLKQMPGGLRRSLYVRDDDLRLSFAQGNYITLTNLSDEDMDRICFQKMSPLYVSVHSTEPEIREHMLGSKRAGRIMEQLRQLADARITVQAQVVLCPGVNDGEHLDRTVHDLGMLHPSVASVAIVPVGLTRYRKGLTLIRPVGPKEAIRVLDACVEWQREFRRSLGTGFVFSADEFFLLADRPFPPRQAYEGFPQLEDGVGVSRLFLDELRSVEKRVEGACAVPGKYVLVTGVLAAEMVKSLADTLNRIPGIECRICMVKNKFLGESVTVVGLLAGHDIACALGKLSKDETVLVPSVAFKDGVFLDDMSLEELAQATGAMVEAIAPSPRAVFRRTTARTVSAECTAGR